jgi:hypothetical protein
VAAPLGLLLAFQRPAPREAFYAALLLGYAAWSAFRGTPGFGRVEGAWVCLVAGAVVVVLAARPPAAGRLVATGLLALAIGATAALAAVGVTRFSFAELRWLSERQFGQQARLFLGLVAPRLGDSAAALELVANDVVRTVSGLFPSLVLLQTLFALALAWSLYRLLARHPEGEPLPPLRAFRFNDHLVWGVVLGILALVWPGAAALRDIGGNLLTFFGGLYVLRGAGIVADLAAVSGVGGPFAWLGAAAFTLFLLPVALFSALAIGVTDTWFDWRRLARRPKSG